ncbi:hypothetical protein U1Q18_026022 [Sarracenia purpurea var. burkii]
MRSMMTLIVGTPRVASEGRSELTAREFRCPEVGSRSAPVNWSSYSLWVSGSWLLPTTFRRTGPETKLFEGARLTLHLVILFSINSLFSLKSDAHRHRLRNERPLLSLVPPSYLKPRWYRDGRDLISTVKIEPDRETIEPD